jgi:ectoine hydroxylase-related dioxygenase (phytanoyl-CoA dioxygenase family)
MSSRNPDRRIALTSAPTRNLTTEEIQSYHESGAWVVRGVLPMEWIEFMREVLQHAMNASMPFAHNFAGSGDQPQFYTDMFSWRYNDGYRQFVMESPLPEIAAQAMDSRSVNLFYDQTFVKEPGSVTATPWHQDLSYWPVKGNDVISLWVPLDSVGSDSGVVQYVKGSHRWNLQYRPVPFDTEDVESHLDSYKDFASVNYDQPPDIDQNRELYEILTWDMNPGDIILHHPLTIHGASGNSTLANRRRAIAVRYTGDDAQFCPEHGAAFPASIMQEAGLRSGEPMGGEVFPLVWPNDR